MGVRLLAELLMAVYEVYFVTVIDVQTNVHHEEISQTIRSLPVRGTELGVRNTWPTLNQLVKHLGVARLIMDDRNCSFEELLEHLPLSSNVIFMMHLMRPIPSLSLIVEVVQKWKAGSSRLHYLGLDPDCIYDANGVRAVSKPLKHFSIEDVTREFKEADQTVRIGRGFSNNKLLLSFKRQSDDLTLHFEYWYNHQSMFLTDIPGQGRVYTSLW